jgi:glyoxylase-like metal-dependent hydrolase (beta-lactamase superfamily II)
MSQAKKFASQADMEEKKITFSQISEHAWAYTAEGDPNTGIVIGDDACWWPTRRPPPPWRRRDPPHPRGDRQAHQVRGAHPLPRGARAGRGGLRPEHILASQDTRDLIVERGEADKASEIGRFPRLFQNVETVPPGLTWPTMTFTGKMTLWLGKLEVQLIQLGRGHTKGDTVVWLPQERTLLSGDLVEFGATPYAGDAYFQDWPQTLDNIAALKPAALVPGRGAALTTPAEVAEGLTGTRNFISDVYASVQEGVKAGRDLNTVYKDTYAKLKPKYSQWVIFDHCMPFDVSRATTRPRAIRRSARVDGRARRRDVEGAGRLSPRRHQGEDKDKDTETTRDRLSKSALRLPPPRRPGRRAARPSPGGDRRRRPGRPHARHRPRAAPGACRAAGQRQHPLQRLARDLLCQAHAGGVRPPGLRRPHGRQGRLVERGQGVLPRRAGLPLRPAARARPRAARPSSTCSSTTSRATSWSAPPRCRSSTCAGTTR